MKGLEKRTTFQRVVFIIVFILFALYALSLLYPFIWAFYNSMKGRDEYIQNSFILPQTFNFRNFAEVFRSFTVSTVKGEVGIIGMFLNSVIFVFITTLLAVVGSATAAYIISKFKFWGSKLVYTAAVFIMIVPSIGLTPALYRILLKFHLTDNILSTAMVMGGCFGMYFMMMYASFESLSWTYAEAGYIDGANDFVVFFRIMLPQVAGQTLALSLVPESSWSGSCSPAQESFHRSW